MASANLPFTVGIDFGTTNSAIAVADARGVRVARFRFLDSMIDTFRSVLFFEHSERRGVSLKPLAGTAAIQRYLEPHDGGRLIQSLKSFAASSAFTSTQIGSRPYKLEELIGVFLRLLRTTVEHEFGPLGDRAVAGRPVRFVGGSKPEDEKRALGRLRRAYEIAGFHHIDFEYEPIGAAYSYAQRLQAPELVLIADFGGGTSDFSLIRLEAGAGRRHEIVATSGVPIGGDTFDATIVRHLVSPMLGLGSSYRSVDKVLPAPASLYRQLESWHHLSFLRTRENLRILESVRAQSLERAKLDRFLEIVEGDLGYHLHRSVQQTKMDLSRVEEAPFMFTGASTAIARVVKRVEFEEWIAGDVRRISGCVENLLEGARVEAEDVDRVFLTGGSSLVPALRATFESRFGVEKLAAGEEFTSVARGLALRG